MWKMFINTIKMTEDREVIFVMRRGRAVAILLLQTLGKMHFLKATQGCMAAGGGGRNPQSSRSASRN